MNSPWMKWRSFRIILLEQAGEGTDVILGMGYDSTSWRQDRNHTDSTGFEHKDPFDRKQPKQKVR